jgi:hypothetical protein
MPSVIVASVSAVLRPAVLLAVVAALVAGCGGDDHPQLVVGAVEDAVREPGRGPEVMKQLHDAGFRADRISSIWSPGQTEPTPDELATLQRVADEADDRGVRLFLSVYPAGSATTPLTPEARSQFAQYARSIVQRVPQIRDVIVGNEPNLNRFWMPQFAADGSDAAAPAYLALLAETYDALKEASADVQVYGGALAPRGIDRPNTGRDTHSPTMFIRDLGAAYRASGRTKPVMDAFAFHPYAERSDLPPDRPHPNSSAIGLADYEKLVGALRRAFVDTGQPSGIDLPILYDEFGVETAVPADKAHLYTGSEPPTTGAADEELQARYYRRALQLAVCYPNVMGILFFHSHDEPDLTGWQSGVYYVDGSKKSSLDEVRGSIQAARDATC